MAVIAQHTPRVHLAQRKRNLRNVAMDVASNELGHSHLRDAI
jgi:hypothetical protein